MRERRSASGKVLVARRYATESGETEKQTVAAATTAPVAAAGTIVTRTHARALYHHRDGSPRRYARANRNGGAAVPECPPASPTPSSPPAHRPPARSRIRRRLGARFAHFLRRRRCAGDRRRKLSTKTTLFLLSSADKYYNTDTGYAVYTRVCVTRVFVSIILLCSGFYLYIFFLSGTKTNAFDDPEKSRARDREIKSLARVMIIFY